MGRPILFAPVSGPGGSGEYYRCLAIARALSRRAPEHPVHFLLHREAAVERDPRCTYHLLDASPTRATPAVIDHIQALRPALAFYDAAGRMAQYRAVSQAGGKLVWLSNRPKKRRKGFRPRMLARIDMHLIAAPGQQAPRLGPWEQVKWRWCGKPEIRFFSTIAPEADPERQASLSRDYGLKAGEYLVFAAGGGGHFAAERPVPEILLDGARRVRRETGLDCVVVMGPQYRGKIDHDDEVTVIPRLETSDLAALLSGARLAVTGAGWMMSSQVLSLGIPAILVPAGGADQPERIRRYQREGLAVAAALEPEAIASNAAELANDSRRRRELVEGVHRAGIRNDTGTIAEALLALIKD